MKRSIVTWISVLLGTLAAALTHAQDTRPIVIGEVTPLTGPAATVGIRLNQVNRMWADDLNRAGGINGRRIELVTCNDEGRPERAASCTRDLIDKGAVLFLLNALTAGVRAAQPLLTNGPVALVLTPNIMPPATSLVFQVSPSEADLTKAIAAYLKASGGRSLAVVAATDASGEVAVQNARRIFPDEGIALKVARIDLRATDASSQLAAVASNDIKAIYSAYSGGGASVVVKSYHDLGLQQPVIVGYANVNAAFIALIKDVLPTRLLGTSIAALVPAALGNAAQRERSLAFARRYQEVYGERPDMLNLIGKLSVDTAEAVLRNVKNPADTKAVRQYLESTRIDSLHTIRFSPDNHVGLTDADVMIVELKAGSWVKADPIP